MSIPRMVTTGMMLKVVIADDSNSSSKDGTFL